MLKKLFGDLFGKKLENQKSPSLEQRRKAVRRPCDIEVEGWMGKRAFNATVVDMGVGGMCLRLESPIPLKNQTIVSVTYPEPLRNCDNLTVDLLARWTRTERSDGSQLIGLEFKDPKGMGRSWVKVKMQDIGFASYNIREQRKDVRVPCRLKATVQIGGEAVPCQVLNIGRGGVYVQMMKPLRAGATVTLRLLESAHLPSATLQVTVRHQQHSDPSDPFGYGLAFQEIDPEFQELVGDYVLKLQADDLEVEPAARAGDAFFDQSDEEAEDVEIPDLQSIMDETAEPEED